MNKFIKIIPLYFLIVIAIGCDLGAGSGGTSTGNPIVQLKFSSFNEAQANKVKNLNNLEAESVNSLFMCFKRLRFKKVDSDTDSNPELDEDNIDIELGEIEVSPTGTNITSVSIEEGTYTRIEFDLENDCISGKSVQLENSQGSFNTDDRITIKFDGQFNANAGNQILSLGIQNLIDALDSVNDNSEIKTKLESVSGDL